MRATQTLNFLISQSQRNSQAIILVLLLVIWLCMCAIKFAPPIVTPFFKHLSNESYHTVSYFLLGLASEC